MAFIRANIVPLSLYALFGAQVALWWGDVSLMRSAIALSLLLLATMLMGQTGRR